mmetsp:Transcript_19129/g.18779  ORF Transcript_19129/g.18779 Transcript_19129/m.18779 type:complete len:232 (-) Transcript_19129:56-751(-)|eukprot:CAMPEP_0197006732 /NCGR_PEP_ID=MMETSP1380-20130617/36720_1 /TAXON_ID=5936 /ORGANISM="Euplotes crassus, Strain CT5" /LENGTH=231 /DNA_ID=CAMNT_0042426443 /DNA_START=24 /DNA_END=719 /DNA_ORIENTATION=+
MAGYGELATDSFELKRFMIQEAHEKAFEIKVMSQRLFEKEKANIIREGKKRVDENLDKERTKLQTELNINRSSKVNKYKMKKMNVRDALMKELVKDTTANFSENFADPESDEYREILKNSILQGLIKLLEPKVLIKCREKDVEVVQGLIEEVQTEFQELMQQETQSEDYTVELEIIEGSYIKEESAAGQCGGVVLCSADKLIVCSNTLDERLSLCYEEFLPVIRRKLFPNT